MTQVHRRACFPGLANLFLPFLFLPFLSGPLSAQGALLEGRMVVDLPPGPDPVPVSMDYSVLPDPGTTGMGVTLLFTGGASVDSVRAFWNGLVVSLDLEEIRPGFWTGTVPFPSGSGEPDAGQRPDVDRDGVGVPFTVPGDTAHIRISYLVVGALEGHGRVVIPVLASEWVPSNPTPRTFLADVRVPPGLSVFESFPTSVVARPKGAEGGVYQVSLQGVPAMLAVRTVEGDAPFLTLERLLDLFVLLFLLVMGVFGVRYLRRQGQ